MPRHPKWGRPIEEYFFQNPGGSFFSDEPATETCSPFVKTLLLLRYPKQLRTINNTMSLSNTVSALQNSGYTHESDPQANKLFNYEYGFMAFRCIILFMQAGILAHTNSFSLFEERAGHLSDPHAVSLALSEFIMELMYESLKKPKPRDWLLGILTSRRGGRMFLRTVGGFFDIDAIALMGVLWQDRKNFLKIVTRAPRLTRGWGLPLLLIAEHLCWATETGLDGQEEWGTLQVLLFRYALVAPDHEMKFIAIYCLRAEYDGYPIDPKDNPDNNKLYQKSLVDADDAETFLTNYLGRIVSPTLMPVPAELAVQLVGFIGQSVVLDIVDWMPSLVEVLCAWSWKFIGWRSGMDSGNDVNLIMHATRTFDLINRLFSKYVGAPSKTISKFAKALAHQDFVALCGRMVLLPLSIDSNISQVADEYPETFDLVIDPIKPHVVPYIWSQITSKVLSVTTSYRMSGKPSNGILSPCYGDWLKIQRCFEADFPQHTSSAGSLHAYKKSALVTYLELGSSFSYSNRRARTNMECINPRCPGAGLESDSQSVCEYCLTASYCSPWCQSRHWDAIAGGSHREVCLATQEPLQQGMH